VKERIWEIKNLSMISNQTLSLLFMELIIKRGGDVMDANAMEFIHVPNF
jgi:hypothetical protein